MQGTIGDMYEDYLRRRKNAVDAVSKENEKLDKAIFILATSPFLISVTFLTGLRDVYLVSTNWLFASWICLGIAIFLHIANYVVNIDRELSEIKTLDKNLGKVAGGVLYANNRYSGDNFRVKIYNDLCIAFTLGGIVTLSIFGAINVLSMNNLNKAKMDSERKGIEGVHSDSSRPKHEAGYGVPPEPFPAYQGPSTPRDPADEKPTPDASE